MNIYENSPTLVRYFNYQPISVENGRSEGLARARCAHASRKTADNMTSAFAQLHGCMQYIVTMGSVVVPYHPVINDMVLVRGATFDDIWKARVIAFNLPLYWVIFLLRKMGFGYQNVVRRIREYHFTVFLVLPVAFG